MQEVDEDREQHLGVEEGSPDAGSPRAERVPLASGEHHRLLVRAEPAGLGRAVGQDGTSTTSGEQHRRRALDQEQPLPAGQARAPFRLEQGAAERAADDVGHRHAHQEVAGGAGLLARAEPGGQVVEHAGEQARLGDAEHHPQHVERGGPVHEGHAHRDQAPGGHDAGDPAAARPPAAGSGSRAPRRRVGQEEQARAEAVDRRRDAHVLLQRGAWPGRCWCGRGS